MYKKILPVLIFLTLVTTTVSAYNPPECISVTGSQLTNSSNYLVQNEHNFTYRFYDSISGGTLVFGKTKNNIDVTDGSFATQVCGFSPSDLNQDLYLEIEMDSNGNPTNRTQITPTIYSQYADRWDDYDTPADFEATLNVNSSDYWNGWLTGSDIDTVGIITNGIWHGDSLSDSYVDDSITIGTGGTVQAEAIDQEGATSNQVLKWDGTNWSPGSDNYGTDTNASTACSAGYYLDGDGSCYDEYDSGDDGDTSSSNEGADNICSGTNYLAGDGSCYTDSYEADTDTNTNANTECSGTDTFYSGDGTCEADSYEADTTISDTNTQLDDETPTSNVDMDGEDIVMSYGYIGKDSSTNIIDFDEASGGIRLTADSDSDANVVLDATGQIDLIADHDSDYYNCYISETDGSWNCDGTKNARIKYRNKIYKTFSSEGAKVWFRDEGTSKLERGEKTIVMSGNFRTIISHKTPLKAHITPKGKCDLYVSNETWKSFTVKGWDGSQKDNCTFNWQATTVRRGYEDENITHQDGCEGWEGC